MGKPKIPISVPEFKYRVEDIEDFLTAPPHPLLSKPYPPKYFVTKEGEKIVIRQASVDEADVILKTLKLFIDDKYDKDFYHLVGVRTYSEILAWKQNRVKDERVLVGVEPETGELVGLVNWRIYNDKIAISLHTMTFKRMSNIGIALYAAKIEDALDILGLEEWWATFESPFGFRMGFRFVHQTKPWPEYQHELGGSRVYYVAKDIWNAVVKPKMGDLLGVRPVSENDLKSTYPLKVPSKIEVEI